MISGDIQKIDLFILAKASHVKERLDCGIRGT